MHQKMHTENKKYAMKHAFIIGLSVLAVMVFAGAISLNNVTGNSAQPEAFDPNTVPNLKVAFAGDFGRNPNTRAVLELIKAQEAELLVGLGDLDYNFRPADWMNQINATLGEDFPLVSSVGNHDDAQWENFYKPLFRERYERTPDLSCAGEIGIDEVCTYKGLFLVLSGAGTLGEEPEVFLQEQLNQNQSVWRVCGWHKNQNAMQLGTKRDEVGWAPYEVCRTEGAIIATGHEHSYQRTRTLIDMEMQVLDPSFPEANQVRVSEGATFAFVSGIGGQSIRNQDRCLPAEPPYGCDNVWASVYTEDQGATFGVLFITFNVDDDPRKAIGEFINIEGEVIDRFEIFNQVNMSETSEE